MGAYGFGVPDYPGAIRHIDPDPDSGTVISLTPAGAIDYARHLNVKAGERYRALELRVAILERELVALKSPSTHNWSA